VVWLDELQRYLDGEHGLTGAMVRALLVSPHQAMIIATLWPDRYASYTTLPASGDADPHTREREVLDLAAVVRIGPEFSPAEQGRSVTAAARDRRLAIALDTADYGLTQTLAAAPQLVARWQDARTASPYAWAVLTAALDAARLGARAPLSADLLRAAAPGYCTCAQQAEAPQNWFEQALAYAICKLHGATAALSPAGAGIMGQVAGYTAADYLIQYASWERRYERVPASTWDAVVSHIGDPADAARLVHSARERLLYRYAIPLYRHAVAVSKGRTASRLAGLLEGRGDLDGAEQALRAGADAGDRLAARKLAGLLEKRRDLGGLRARADADDQDAARPLARLLERRGDLDGLRARADRGDENAARRLAGLLEKRRDLGGLRARADAGDQYAARRLAWLLIKRGDRDEGMQMLAALANAGDAEAAAELGGLLAERGDLDGAVQILRGPADADGELDGQLAAAELVGLLAERGELDELRARPDAGDKYAAQRLADLLAERGDLDELRARAEIGDEHAAERLADLLIEQGRGEEADRLRRFGLNPDGSIACA
jgi:hypothetical protein